VSRCDKMNARNNRKPSTINHWATFLDIMTELQGLKIEFSNDNTFTVVTGKKRFNAEALRRLFRGMGIETEIGPAASEGEYLFRAA